MQASPPFARAAAGAISLIICLGAGRQYARGDKRYPLSCLETCTCGWRQITLHAFDAGKLAEGNAYPLSGIDIGQIQKLTLITARNEVQATAVLLSGNMQTFARSGTRFPW